MSRPNRLTRPAACLLAACAGAALMYFFDPELGHARRARMQPSRLPNAMRAAGDALEPIADAVLVERVRTALGHTIANPDGIDVKAFDGRVVLKGPVTPEELAEIVACTRRVRGVREVDNRLSLNTGISTT
jgi:hypothetical protein